MNDHRFWRKVERRGNDECWPWTGYKRSSGHGVTSYQSMPVHASKKAWILTHGPILSGLCVNHRCDSAECCNPAHLYLGTRADNMIDRWGKTKGSERAERGRPHVLTADQVSELYQMRRNGASIKECVERFNCCHKTIYRIINKQRAARLAQLRQRVRRSATDVQA